MEDSQYVEIPKVRNWRKATWSKQVRALAIGDSLEVSKDYLKRMSQYVGAKRAFPGARFSVQRQYDGSFKMIRTQ